ncbi:MAG TPA: hypothetical protein VNG71_02080 [Pyrinomonadaceae bacterium]|nr:hypothetical protein [Pyrinomonadaceae bacterium]
MRDYLQRIFAANSGLPVSAFSDNLTLAEVVAQSEQMHNSVDLIEAFARTANVLERDKGVRVRLPAFSLDTRVSTVLETIQVEIDRQRTETAGEDF